MSEARTRITAFLLILKDLWNLGLLIVRNLQPVMVLAMAGLIAWAMLSRQPWPFSIEAESEHVSLLLAHDRETNWRIDGAQLCIRANAEALVLPVLEEPSLCPGPRWRAYDLREIDEVTLRLPAVPPEFAGYTASLDVEPDRSLAIQVSGKGIESLALLAGGSALPVPIGHNAIIRFPTPGKNKPPGRLLLPFSGAGTIGKDVSWRESTLLRRGSVALYTRSDEAAGGRELVASTELMPGDRVDLRQHARKDGVVTKGFIHFDLSEEFSEPPAMKIVAFGEAESIRILRFGEQSYSFSPGMLSRLTHHSAVSTWVVLIVSLLGFMAVYREGAEIGEGDFLERRRKFIARWHKFWSPQESSED